MMADGISHAATVYAMHAFAMLPSGEIDALGVRSDDGRIIEGTEIYTQWISFLTPDASHDAVVDEENGGRIVNVDRAEGATKPIPLFFRACQGHS
eukprot:7397348-Pyramimonas_sp.AAC.1